MGLPKEDEVPLLLAQGSGVAYFDVFDSDRLSIGIFLMQKGMKLPLHDHPRMSVYSKVLFGQIKTTSYDWIDHPFVEIRKPLNTERWPARRCSEITSHARTLDVDAVLPSEGNLHTIEALTTAAFIDVIGPPYDEHRQCTYYRILDPKELEHYQVPEAFNNDTNSDDDVVVWLAVDQPNFYCDHLPYEGPPVDDQLFDLQC